MRVGGKAMNADIAVKEGTIALVQQGFAAGTLSCAGLAGYYLDAIEKDERAGQSLRAIIAVNPSAAGDAGALDALPPEKRNELPLYGVPVLLKDNCETRDMPTTAGSLSLQGWRTGRDAFIVQKLREAGAVILAKTNLHEFAVWGETVSSIKGASHNPYDHTRTPGGSSGGTGAAVAANLGMVGIGTDTINSIRSPASACSLCGIRPTVGLVSRGGIVPYSLTQDTAGPLARTVEDAVRVLDVIAGHDPADPATEAALGQKPDSFLPFLKKGGLSGKRLGVLKHFFGREDVNRPVNAVLSAALAMMAEAGAELVVIDEAIDSTALVRDVSLHLHDLKAHLGAYLSAFGSGAPVHSIDEILKSGRYTPDIEANLLQANALSTDTPEYAQRMEKRRRLQERVLQIMTRERLDAFVYPHQQQLVCKIGASQLQRNGVLASVTGYPAVAVPAGFSPANADAPLGVPVGVEFMGRPFDEGGLIEIAYGFEQFAHQRRMPLPMDAKAAALVAGLMRGLL